MGIRETLNKNPQITTGVTAGIIVVALLFILWQAMSGGGGGGTVLNERFYSIDDGKTWFAEDINKVPPFQHDGKDAVVAQVFTCDDGGTLFVAYLERFTPEAKKKLEEMQAKAQQGGPQGPQDMAAFAQMEQIMMTGREVKKPGDGQWVKATDRRAQEILSGIKCPEGQSMENLRHWTPAD